MFPGAGVAHVALSSFHSWLIHSWDEQALTWIPWLAWCWAGHKGGKSGQPVPTPGTSPSSLDSVLWLASCLWPYFLWKGKHNWLTLFTGNQILKRGYEITCSLSLLWTEEEQLPPSSFLRPISDLERSFPKSSRMWPKSCKHPRQRPKSHADFFHALGLSHTFTFWFSDYSLVFNVENLENAKITQEITA